MGKSYLRYRPERTFGLLTSGGPALAADAGARAALAFVAQGEGVGVLNVRRGVQVATLLPPGDDAAARADVTRLAATPPAAGPAGAGGAGAGAGARLAAGYSDGMVRVFDVAKGALSMALTGHRRAVSALAWAPDAALLASGSRDTDVIVWDALAEAGVVRFRGHSDEVTGVAFAGARGRALTLVSASKDTTLRVWDVAARAALQTLVGARGELWALTALRGRVYAGGSDNLLRVWAVEGDGDGAAEVGGASGAGARQAASAAAAAAGAGGGGVLTPSSLAAAAGGAPAAALRSLGAVVRSTHERAVALAGSTDGGLLAVASAGRLVELYRRRTPDEVRRRVLRRLRRAREKAARRERAAAAAAAGGAGGGEGGDEDDEGDGDGDGDGEGEGGGAGAMGTSLAELDAAIGRLEAAAAAAAADAAADAPAPAPGAGAGAPAWGEPTAGDELELVGIAQAGARVTGVVLLDGGALGGGDAGAASAPGAAALLLLSLADNRLELHTLPLTPGGAGAGAGGRTFTAPSGATLPLASLARSVAAGGHRSDVRAIALSDDGALLLTASVGEAKVWNARTGAALRTLSLAAPAAEVASGAAPGAPPPPGRAAAGGAAGLCVAFGPGARHAFVGTKDGRLLSFDVGSGDRIEVHAAGGAGGAPVWALAARHDGRALASGGGDKEVKFWDFELTGGGGGGGAGAGAGGGAGGGAGRSLSLVHARTLKVGDEVLALAYSRHADPANVLLAVALLDSTVKVFYDDTLRFFLSLYGHKLPVTALDISADGTLLASASADKSVKVWGLDFGDLHRSFPAHADGVTGVAWVGSTHYFLSVGRDRAVRYWDGDRFERILSLEGFHKGEVWAVAAARDGKAFFTAGADRAVRAWARTAEQVFLEEEREAALDAALERGLREPDGGGGEEPLGGRADYVGPLGGDGLAAPPPGPDGAGVPTAPAVPGTGLLSEATTIVAAATRDTARGAERLADALAAAAAASDAWLEFAQDAAAAAADGAAGGAAPGLNPPPPPPELLGLTPARFVLRALRAVRPSDVESVLLTMPAADAVRFLRYAAVLLRDGAGVEVLARAVLLILRVHGRALAGARTLLPLVARLRAALAGAVGAAADVAGYNAAALRLLDARLEQHDEAADAAAGGGGGAARGGAGGGAGGGGGARGGGGLAAAPSAHAARAPDAARRGGGAGSSPRKRPRGLAALL